MKAILTPLAILLIANLARAGASDRIKGPVVEAEQHMVGAWTGQGGCDGSFVFRADGGYSLTGYGPAGDEFKGTWKVRWDELPATLVLTHPDEEAIFGVRVMQFQLLKLNKTSLTIGYPDSDGKPSGVYLRPGK